MKLIYIGQVVQKQHRVALADKALQNFLRFGQIRQKPYLALLAAVVEVPAAHGLYQSVADQNNEVKADKLLAQRLVLFLFQHAQLDKPGGDDNLSAAEAFKHLQRSARALYVGIVAVVENIYTVRLYQL